MIIFLANYYSKIPYKSAKILTPGELRFYKVLRYILRGKYDVFAQVRLVDLVEVPGGLIWQRFHKLGLKTVDFVICDRNNGETLLVIELDDKTHEMDHRARRDYFVDKVLKTANIPVLHYNYKRHYDEKELNDIIERTIKKSLFFWIIQP